LAGRATGAGRRGVASGRYGPRGARDHRRYARARAAKRPARVVAAAQAGGGGGGGHRPPGQGLALFLLSGERATDPAAAIPCYGSLKSGRYDGLVLELLGLEEVSRLLPEVVDDTRHLGRMSMAGAAATGLREDMAVVLAPPDVLAAALAAGAYGGEGRVACTVLDGAAFYLASGGRQRTARSVARPPRRRCPSSSPASMRAWCGTQAPLCTSSGCRA
jgi:hypothetical protein